MATLFTPSANPTSRQAGGRRSLLAPPAVDLADEATMEAVLVAAQKSAAITYRLAINSVSSGAIKAAAAGLANVNMLAADTESAEETQKVSKVAQVDVAKNMADLGSNTITPAEFTKNTSITQLKALQDTTVITEGTTKKKKKKLSGGQIAGIVIGTIVGAALLVALGVFVARR